MNEQVEQRIRIKFCVRLENSSTETIQMIQKAAALGNRWLAALLQLHNHACLMCSATFFGNTSNDPGDTAPYSPDLAPCDFWAVPKTKISFEREEISDCRWDSGKHDGAADGHWENCVRPQGTYFEGARGITGLRTMFLVPCIFFSKCLYCSYHMNGHFLDRSCTYISILLAVSLKSPTNAMSLWLLITKCLHCNK